MDKSAVTLILGVVALLICVGVTFFYFRRYKDRKSVLKGGGWFGKEFPTDKSADKSTETTSEKPTKPPKKDEPIF